MRETLSIFFLILYFLGPIFGLVFIPEIVEKNYLNFENLDWYIYLAYSFSWLIAIGAFLGINHLFGGNALRVVIVLSILSVVSSLFSPVLDWITFAIQFAKNFILYWLINLPFDYLRRKKVNISKNEISPALHERFEKEIVLKFDKKISELPQLAWCDYSLCGFLFARFVAILDSEIPKIKPKYNCSFENDNYSTLYEILVHKLRSQYPKSNIINSIFDLKTKDGFIEGMKMDDETFDKYLDKINHNYNLDSEEIDRSNMVPQTDYAIQQSIKKFKGKIKETFDELKGIKRLRSNIQDVKNLRDEKTITEDEYIKLRKSVLEKYVANNNKDASTLKAKLNEIENLRDENVISNEEFSDLRKIIINKYA